MDSRNTIADNPEKSEIKNHSHQKTVQAQINSHNEHTPLLRESSLKGSFRHRYNSDSERSFRKSLVGSSFRWGGQRSSVRDFGGTVTIPNLVFSLVKNIVGVGVLSLSYGVAAFANSPPAILPATIIIIFFGVVFGYYFLLLGKICQMTYSATYREAWEETIGDRGSDIVALVNTIKPGLANLSYSMVLADTFCALFTTIGFDLSRTESLLVVTIFALLPLCLLKNLNVLAPSSILGLIGFILIAVVMGIRYFDGSYDINRNGRFLEDLDEKYQPKFGNIGLSGSFTVNALILVCMVFESFVAHYNAPRFYTELKDPTMSRFGRVVSYSFGVSALIFVAIASFGFLTFGSNCDGFILNNYSTRDELATICRIAVAFALIFTYPLTFIGMRDGVLDLLVVPAEKQTSVNINALSVILLALVTILALLFHDLGLVSAVGGGTLGTIVVFVFPAIMYQGAVRKQGGPGSHNGGLISPTDAQQKEVTFAIVFMWLGIGLGCIGVWVALVAD